MKQNFLKNIEWNLLRGTLIWAIACFMLGVTAMILSYEHKMEKIDLEEKYELNLRSLTSKINKTNRDREIYHEYLPRIEKQIKKGFIGALKRVVWVDVLHKVTSNLKLPDMQYNISEQTDYISKGQLMPEGDFSIVKSIMHINMNIYHEEDLFTLLDLLTEESKAFFQVKECSMRQTRAKAINKIDEPNLSVQCDLVWIALLNSKLDIDNINKLGDKHAQRVL